MISWNTVLRRFQGLASLFGYAVVPPVHSIYAADTPQEHPPPMIPCLGDLRGDRSHNLLLDGGQVLGSDHSGDRFRFDS